MLNAGDYFTFQALTSGVTPKFTPDSRLIGTSKTAILRQSRPFSTVGDKVAIAFWCTLLLFMAFMAILMDTATKKTIFFGVPLVIISAIFYTWARSRFSVEASRYLDDA